MPGPIKLMLIGDSLVGKSSLLHRFCEGAYVSQMPTIGIDYRRKLAQVDGKQVALSLWDTAGQQQFRHLIRSYYQGSHGLLLCFGVNNRSSFEHVEFWLLQIKDNCRENVPVLLIATKADLLARQVSSDEGRALASRHGIEYFQASARMGFGVEQVFMRLATLAVQKGEARAEGQRLQQGRRWRWLGGC